MKEVGTSYSSVTSDACTIIKISGSDWYIENLKMIVLGGIPAIKKNNVLYLKAIALLILTMNPLVIAKASDNVDVCKIGVYLNELFDFSTQKKSFSGDLWLWSICENPEKNAAENIDFINAITLQDSELYIEEKKEGIYSFRRFKGRFHQAWVLDHFPFDRHKLIINIEDSVYDENKLGYKADLENSGINQNLYLQGWRITNFSLNESGHHYPTNYGDPDLENGSNYSRISIVVDISRANYLVFFRMTSGVYAAILIALMTFFMNSKYESLYSGQLALVVGALFAVLVNYQSASRSMGYVPNLTLIDMTHIVALTYIVMIGVNVLYNRYQINQHPENKPKIPNFPRFLIFICSYVGINVFLIFRSYYLMH